MWSQFKNIMYVISLTVTCDIIRYSCVLFFTCLTYMLIWLYKELLVKICFIVIFCLIQYSFYNSFIKFSIYGTLCTLENRTCSTFEHHHFEHLCQLFWMLTSGVLDLNISGFEHVQCVQKVLHGCWTRRRIKILNIRTR